MPKKERKSKQSKRGFLFKPKSIIKAIVVATVYVFIYAAMQLPYINIIQHIFAYLPHLVSLSVFIFLYRPAKERLLLAALFLFVPNYIVFLLGNLGVSELLSVMSYFLLGFVVILFLKDFN